MPPKSRPAGQKTAADAKTSPGPKTPHVKPPTTPKAPLPKPPTTPKAPLLKPPTTPGPRSSPRGAPSVASPSTNRHSSASASKSKGKGKQEDTDDSDDSALPDDNSVMDATECEKALQALLQQLKKPEQTSTSRRNLWRKLIFTYCQQWGPARFPNWVMGPDKLGGDPDLVLQCLTLEFGKPKLEEVWPRDEPITSSLATWFGVPREKVQLLGLWLGADSRTPSRSTIRKMVDQLAPLRPDPSLMRHNYYPAWIAAYAQQLALDMSQPNKRVRAVLARRFGGGSNKKALSFEHWQVKATDFGSSSVQANSSSNTGESASTIACSGDNTTGPSPSDDEPVADVRSSPATKTKRPAPASWPSSTPQKRLKGSVDGGHEKSSLPAPPEQQQPPISLVKDQPGTSTLPTASPRPQKSAERLASTAGETSSLPADSTAPKQQQTQISLVEDQPGTSTPPTVSSRPQTSAEQLASTARDTTPVSPFKNLTTKDATVLDESRELNDSIIDQFLEAAAFTHSDTTTIGSLFAGNGNTHGTHLQFRCTRSSDRALCSRVFVIFNPGNKAENRGHWVCMLIDRLAKTTTIYDSSSWKRTLTRAAAIVNDLNTTVPGLDASTTITPGKCPQQKDTTSCGVYALAFAWLTISKVDMPEHLEPKLWRALFRAMARGRTLRDELGELLVAADDFPVPSLALPSPATARGLAALRQSSFRQHLLANIEALQAYTREYRRRVASINHLGQVILPCLSHMRSAASAEIPVQEGVVRVAKESVAGWEAARASQKSLCDSAWGAFAQARAKDLQYDQRNQTYRLDRLREFDKAIAALEIGEGVHGELARAADEYRGWIAEAEKLMDENAGALQSLGERPADQGPPVIAYSELLHWDF